MVDLFEPNTRGFNYQITHKKILFSFWLLNTINSPLNGRGILQHVDERAMKYQCRSDSTYMFNDY